MQSSEYKLLLTRGILFLMVFILIDQSLGRLTKGLFLYQKTGKYARITHTLTTDSSQILIMGSSHANRHFVPSIFQSNLNTTCYNAGVQGQGLIFQTALQKMIFKRRQPQLLIMNLDEGWLFESEESYERLADLHPYFWEYKTELEPILSLNERFIVFKLLFQSYQTNSTIVHIINYFLKPQPDENGYRPLTQEMSPPAIDQISLPNQEALSVPIPTIDTNFVNMFKEFISNAKEKNVPIVFTISPRLYPINITTSNASLNMMKKLASESNIKIFDFSGDVSFIGKYHLFSDPGHLNHQGASLFSQMLTDSLKTHHSFFTYHP
jgi:hypothetical protein